MRKLILILFALIGASFADTDLNDDCIVNYEDFSIFALDWLHEDPNIINSETDFNSDDVVDLDDLALFASDWLDTSICNPVDSNSIESITTHISSEITLTATDLNNDTLSYIITSLPAHGYLRDRNNYPCTPISSVPYTLTGNSNVICYETVSASNTSFNWKANDGTNDSDGATVSLTVTAHPKDHLSFGKDGIVTIADANELDISGNFGFAMFLKTYVSDCNIVSKYEPGVGGWEYKLVSGKPTLLLYGSSGLTDTVTSEYVINDGSWYNVGFVYDPNTTPDRVRLTDSGWESVTTADYTNAADLKVGLGYWWDIDNIRFYTLTTYYNRFYGYIGIFEQPRDTAGTLYEAFGITVYPGASVRFHCDYDGTNNTSSQIYDDLANHYTGSINSKRYIRYYPYFMDPCKE